MLDPGIRRRADAAFTHLLLSGAVAACAAALVFGLWYPGEYRHLAGGQGLFSLVISVDIVLGPLLTLVVFDVAKGWRHLKRDIVIIGALQLAGLAYGLHTVYAVRPVATVFEVDRFRVVTAANVYEKELSSALPQYRSLPLTGPWVLSTRPASSADEHSDALFLALEQGVDVGDRPKFWRPYGEARASAIRRARPLTALLDSDQARAHEHRAAVARKGLAVGDATFLPVIARGDWVAVLDKNGDIVTFLSANGFF